jgi:hypothetical protein
LRGSTHRGRSGGDRCETDLLIGIGVLVELLRRLGFAFVAVRAEEQRKTARDPE